MKYPTPRESQRVKESKSQSVRVYKQMLSKEMNMRLAIALLMLALLIGVTGCASDNNELKAPR